MFCFWFHGSSLIAVTRGITGILFRWQTYVATQQVQFMVYANVFKLNVCFHEWNIEQYALRYFTQFAWFILIKTDSNYTIITTCNLYGLNENRQQQNEAVHPIVLLKHALLRVLQLVPSHISKLRMLKLNLLVPGRRSSNFKTVISKHMLRNEFMSSSCEFYIRWMPQNAFDDKSALVRIMSWYSQATSHHLSQ